MSTEAVKKRLQRAIRAAKESFSKDYEVERIYHPFFHLKATLGEEKRWIRIVLDASSDADRRQIKAQKEPGRKELRVRRKGDKRFDIHYF